MKIINLNEEMFDPNKVNRNTKESDADLIKELASNIEDVKVTSQKTAEPKKKNKSEINFAFDKSKYVLDSEDEAEIDQLISDTLRELTGHGLYGTTDPKLEVDDDMYSIAANAAHHMDLLGENAKYFDGVETYEDDTLEKALQRVYITNKKQKEQQDYSDSLVEQTRLRLSILIKRGNLTVDEARAVYAALEKSNHAYVQVANLLVMGEPGGGKTSIIRQWGESHRLKIVIKTAAEITQSVIRGIPYAVDPDNQEKIARECDDDNSESSQKMRQDPVQVYLKSTFFDDLILSEDDRQHYDYSVLFLDEINRGYPESEAGLLTLIQDHTINDRNALNGRFEFSDMLFTVAACNPPNSNPEARKLSLAMNTRFGLYIWNSSPKEMQKFITGQLKIASRAWKFGLKHPKQFDYAGTIHEDKNPKLMIQELPKKQLIVDIVCNDSSGFTFSSPEECARVGDPFATTDPSNIHVINSRTFYTALVASNGEFGLDPNGGQDYPIGSFMYTFREYCTTNPDKLKQMTILLKQYKTDTLSKANSFTREFLGRFTMWKQSEDGAKAYASAGLKREF